MSNIRYVEALVTRHNITIGSIYEVITYYEQTNTIEINDDKNRLKYQMNYNNVWFKDVTIEIRTSTINDILQ